MTGLDIIKVVGFFNKSRRVDVDEGNKGEWKLHIQKRGDPQFHWNFKDNNYRVPKEYHGPFGKLIYNITKKGYVFHSCADGEFVRREDYEALENNLSE